MRWSLRFQLRQYWMGSLWLIPAICAIGAFILGQAMVQVDRAFEDLSWFDYDQGMATSMLSSLLGASITFTGFVLTMLLLVPQFASSQLSARVLHLLYRDPRLKLVFGVFLGAIVFSFTIMARTRGGFVPGLSLWMAGMLVFADVLFFVAFVSHFVQQLRPATAAASVADKGRQVILDIYPPRSSTPRASAASLPQEPDIPERQILNAGPSGFLLAVGHEGLVRAATAAGCQIELTYAVGEYVSKGAPLATIVGPGEPINDDAIRDLIATGKERTFEQDPLFALRVLVDIAAKALSPAINDPTTATHVLDHIGDLLKLLMTRDLTNGEIRDVDGVVRVVIPSPTWQEFLLVGVTEIRIYGREAIQVAIRIGVLLNDLLDSAPPEYRPSIRAELDKLNESIDQAIILEADRRLARGLSRIGKHDNEAGRVSAGNETTVAGLVQPGGSLPARDQDSRRPTRNNLPEAAQAPGPTSGRGE